MTPGDLVLIKSPRTWRVWQCWDTWLVWLGQTVRVLLGHFLDPYPHVAFHVKLRLCAYSHAALLATPITILQSDEQGVHESPLSDLNGTDCTWIDSGDTEADRAEVLAYARSLVGHTYGFVRFFFLVPSYVTGLAFSFGIDGWRFCSGYVADAEGRGKAIYPRDAQNMAPLDMALFYRLTA